MYALSLVPNSVNVYNNMGEGKLRSPLRKGEFDYNKKMDIN